MLKFLFHLRCQAANGSVNMTDGEQSGERLPMKEGKIGSESGQRTVHGHRVRNQTKSRNKTQPSGNGTVHL